MCFDFLYKVCLKYLSFYEELSDVVSQMYIGHHVQQLLFLSCCNWNSNFLNRFSKNTQI
jgi:hypothetical protein